MLSALMSGTLAALFGLLTAGLLSAMVGLHHAVVHLPLAVVAAIVMYRLLPHDEPHAAIPPAVAALLALSVLATVGLNIALHSELVIAGRDGATYTNTAKFLIDDADLFPDFAATPFTGEDLAFSAPGFVVRDDGTAWQQFLHATSTVYATAGELFGSQAIFVVNAFVAGIALLVLFGLAMRFVNPGWALLAVGIIAASLPFIYYGRTTFSEMSSLVMSAGGLWAGHVALSRRPGAAFAAGLLLGAATLARVDAWMLGVGLALLLVTVRMLEEDVAVVPIRQMLGGFAVTAALGFVDLALFSEPYLTSLGMLIFALVFATVGLWAAAPIAATAPFRLIGSALDRWGATAVAILLGVGFVFLAVVRPLLPPVQAPGVYGLEAIQLVEGSAIEPDRSYGELSVWWLVWYLGVPIVLSGLTAVTVATRHSLRRGATALRFTVLLALVPLVAYLIRPSINPDHIWAIRRFLPVAIPAVVIGAVALGAALVGRVALNQRARQLALAMVAASVVPVALASAPLAFRADRPDVATQFEALCGEIGDGAAVAVVDSDPELPLSWLLGPPLRSWCGASVAGAPPGRIPAADIVIYDADLAPDVGGQRFDLRAMAWQSRLIGAPNTTVERSLELLLVEP